MPDQAPFREAIKEAAWLGYWYTSSLNESEIARTIVSKIVKRYPTCDHAEELLKACEYVASRGICTEQVMAKVKAAIASAQPKGK